MSEKLKIHIEQDNDTPESAEFQDSKAHESENTKPEQHSEQTKAEKQEELSAIRQEINKEAKSLNKSEIDSTKPEKNPGAQGPINKELKDMMRTRTLTRIRKELSAPNKTLSKVIHSKPVEKASVIGEKTIARPIGLLGGALIALIGSVATLYMAKHYGFEYNLLLFFILFAGGYLAFTIVEVLILIAKRIKQ